MDAMYALAAPRRRDILRLCWHEERSAGEIAAQFTVTFGAVSQHLRVLLAAGLVTVRRQGTRRLYRANQEALGPLAGYLESLWAEELNRLTTLAEQAESGPVGGEDPPDQEEPS